MNAGIKLALTLAVLPQALPAQGILDQFSYEGIRLSGVSVEIGAVSSNRLSTALSPAIRLDLGYIAPHVRVLLGGSWFRGDFNPQEIARFETRLRALVVDPDNNFTIDVGQIRWANWVGDLDLQYVVPMGAVTPYLGAGLGIHVRNGTGTAIENTFVEDALDTFAAGINVSAGFLVRLTPLWYLTGDARGSLTSELRSLGLRGGVMIRIPKGRSP